MRPKLFWPLRLGPLLLEARKELVDQVLEEITHSHVCGKHRGGDSGGWTQQRLWWSMRGHQKRTRFCQMVGPLAMLEDEMHNEEAEVQGSPPPAASRAVPGASAEEVAVMSIFAVLRCVQGRYPQKQTRMQLHVLCWLCENKSQNHMHTQKEQVTSAVQPEYRNPIISEVFNQMDSFQARGARPLSPIHLEGPLAAPLSAHHLSCSQESQMSPCAGPTSFAVGRYSPRTCVRPHPTWLERNREQTHMQATHAFGRKQTQLRDCN